MDAFFDIVGRELLDASPPDVDREAWAAFREEFAKRERLESASFPIQIDVELNGGCNMRCPFCIHGYDKIPNVELSRESFERILSEAVRLGAKSLKLNYINEPLMRRDLEECISLAKSVGFLNVFVVTNGTLLTEKRSESLLGSGLTKLFVSIDAATPETYDKQRLSGKYDLVVRNVKRFIEMRNDKGLSFPLVRVSFLKNALNISEAEDFRRQWSGIADIITFQTMNEVPGENTGIALDAPEPQQGCQFPFKQLVIDHQGNIQPCCKLAGKDLVVGKIDDMTLAEAWNHPKFVELRRMHAANEWKGHPVCGPCMMPRGKNEPS